jgi:hypothetical protein
MQIQIFLVSVSVPMMDKPWTALRAASCEGNPAIVRLLLESKVDVNIQGQKFFSFRGWKSRIVPKVVNMGRRSKRHHTEAIWKFASCFWKTKQT